MNAEKEKIIEEERLKNDQLVEELRGYEENILLGIMPRETKVTGTNSHKESPDSPKHKGLKLVKKSQAISWKSQAIS